MDRRTILLGVVAVLVAGCGKPVAKARRAKPRVKTDDDPPLANRLTGEAAEQAIDAARDDKAQFSDRNCLQQQSGPDNQCRFVPGSQEQRRRKK